MTDEERTIKMIEDLVSSYNEEQRNLPYINDGNRTLNLNDVLREIRSRTEYGNKIIYRVMSLRESENK